MTENGQMENGQDLTTLSERFKDFDYDNRLHIMSHIQSRLASTAFLGRSYGGRRDLYGALGYKPNLVFEDFAAMYCRGDIAKRIVDQPASTTWKGGITFREEIGDGERGETKFEIDSNKIWRRLKLNSKGKRLDKAAGIGRYAVMLIGVNDGLKLDQEIGKVKNGVNGVTFISIFTEGNADIAEFEADKESPRFSLPKSYNLTVRKDAGSKTGAGSGTTLTNVHWTRVIHVADDPIEDDVNGTPRLEAVFNRLEDVQRIAGSSGEMIWRGAFMGMQLNADSDTEMDDADIKKVKKEADEWLHDWERVLVTRGMKANSIGTQISDTSKAFEVEMKLISGTKGIPLRVLMGSERGELASSQDERAFRGLIEERREDFAEPEIVRAIMNKFIEIDAVSDPTTVDYLVDWGELFVIDPKDQAQINKDKAITLKAYQDATVLGQTVIDESEARTEWLDLPLDRDTNTGHEEPVDEDDPDVGDQFSNP